jgi:uncharacterized membrane protein SpoIIM required for sporulation
MNVAQLLERRRAAWSELEMLCLQLERRGPRRLGASGVSRFAFLYRAACADLALADAYQIPADTVRYLHALVGRAHNQLYRSQTFRFREWGREMFVDLPRRMLGDRTLWLAFAIFWGTFALSLWLGYASRSFAEQLVGEASLAEIESNYSSPLRGRDSNIDSQMAGFYVFNNAGIGLRCFAAGLLFGVGGLFITVSNAVQLGAIFGHMLTVGQRANFLEFVTAHGPFELTAIVFASAAGMRLGFSLISTGDRSRGESLRRSAVLSAPMAAAAVVLFSLAAVIEGFVSPSDAPYPVKAGVAVVCTGLLALYLAGHLLVRRRSHAD